MRLSHVVLFAVATSVLTYLDSVFKDDDDRALRDLEELTEDIEVLVSADDNEEDISEEADDLSDSLRYIGDIILEEVPVGISEEDIQAQAQELIDKIDAYLAEIGLMLEEDEEVQEETIEELIEEAAEDLMPFDEDDYLEQIQKMIDATIALDEVGEPVDMTAVLAVEDSEVDIDEIDRVFKEILAQEGYSQEPVDLTATEDDYLEALANELKEALEEDPVPTQEDIYASINELYPYLNMNFIRSVYDLKEEIADTYPLDARVLLLHRIGFVVLDELRQFVEIVLDHGYRVNVDEDKMIVDVFKVFDNEDGKILANVFDIANQARVLDGSYEGYHVEVL